MLNNCQIHKQLGLNKWKFPQMGIQSFLHLCPDVVGYEAESVGLSGSRVQHHERERERAISLAA